VVKTPPIDPGLTQRLYLTGNFQHLGVLGVPGPQKIEKTAGESLHQSSFLGPVVTQCPDLPAKVPNLAACPEKEHHYDSFQTLLL